MANLPIEYSVILLPNSP